MDVFTRFKGMIFGSKNSAKNADEAKVLAFDELNPLLAKQLSELETQIGQFAQAQFEIAAEREKMRIDMEYLRKAIEKSAPVSAENQVDAMR